MDDRYEREVMLDGPSLFWRMHDRDGATALKDTNGLRDMTPTNVKLGRPGPWQGQRARSALFDRSLSARAGMARWANFGSNTYEAWVRTTNLAASPSYAGDPAMVVFGDTSNNVWMTFGVHAGKVRFSRFNNTAWQTVDSTTVVADGEWHHIAATYDSSTRAVVVYVDGAVSNTGSIAAHQAQGGVDAIGQGYPGNTDHFDGNIAEAALYGLVVPPHRMRAHFLAGRALFARPRLLGV